MADEIIAQLEAAEDDQFDLDELTEALSTVALIDEQRFDEIAESVTECQNRLQTISTKLDENPESPLLTQLLTSVTDLRTDQAKILAELENLKSSLSTLRQSESVPPTVVLVPSIPATESSEPVAEQSTDGPVPVEVPPTPEPPQRRRRVNLL